MLPRVSRRGNPLCAASLSCDPASTTSGGLDFSASKISISHFCLKSREVRNGHSELLAIPFRP